MKHVLNRAVAWGYVKNSPAGSVKKTKEAPGRTRYLAAAEREALLAAAAPTLRPYIVAALQTGARRGEVRGLAKQRRDKARAYRPRRSRDRAARAKDIKATRPRRAG